MKLNPLTAIDFYKKAMISSSIRGRQPSKKSKVRLKSSLKMVNSGSMTP